MNRGTLYAIGAYLIWGSFPVYFKQLHQVAALEVIGHRIVWSFVALAAVVVLSREAGALLRNIRSARAVGTYAVAAALIAINWLVFVWAVNNGHVVECSLGYFIAPLTSVLFGVALLRERMRAWQWVAISLAAAGVLYLTLSQGALPWIALTLAISFGLYGLVKKVAPLGAVHGLTLETGLLLLPALIYLLYLERAGQGAFLHAGAATEGLLFGAGIVTTLPLLLFASATKRIPLSLIGLLQYITPTIHFLMGVLFYAEPFARVRAIGFGLVWLALVIFSAESWRARRAPPVVAD
ncbi:MAG TPA: EamA family transporter RarD [Burkholderiales bacterium]|nr:EamA family transporter RarD [Burkholderiales bacterium]